MSTIRAYVHEGEDPDEVFAHVLSKINKLRQELPAGSDDPVVQLGTGDDVGDMYLSFTSEEMDLNQITDYLIREVEPKLATIPGVQRANIEGDRSYAMRIWLDPARMAALDVTASDVRQALISSNVLSAVGATKSIYDAAGSQGVDRPQRSRTVRRYSAAPTRQHHCALARRSRSEARRRSYASSTTFTGNQYRFWSRPMPAASLFFSTPT